MNNEPSANSERALARHAAISWVEQELAEGHHLNRALALCSERPWGQRLYAAATIEEWYYAHRAGGFAALQRKARSDKGRRKALTPEARQALRQLRQEYPQLKVQALVRRLTEQGLLLAGTFSLPSVYRFLAEEGLDRRSLKLAPANVLSGPTKAFETGRANELWMADMMVGPTLKLSTDKVQPTRLFCLLDDCSRLIPHGQYYGEEKLVCFLDCLRQGVAQRGFPDKLYTDRGKVFTCQHLQIVCANLGIRLLHAKPYHAWSRGKLERFFRTLQEDFQARLVFAPVHSLEELNQRFWQWLETEYHQRQHSSLAGLGPAQRFVQRALGLRLPDPDTDWQRLFLTRAQRRVRLDATVSLEGQLWEVPVHLRGRQVQLRYNPFDWLRVEVWLKDQFVGLAIRCNKNLNAKTFSEYDRPDKSS